MQMNNMAELITVSKYWKDWSDPRWICMVMNNEDLNQVTWEQRIQDGSPKVASTQRLPDVPYHKFAELIGLQGIFVDDPEQLAPAWERALAASRPVVLEVKCDGEVPPLPPHITLEEAKHFAHVSLAGDPDEAGMLLGSAKQLLSKVLPHADKVD
jgi:pyruvate dehydrogenase (quinone)